MKMLTSNEPQKSKYQHLSLRDMGAMATLASCLQGFPTWWINDTFRCLLVKHVFTLTLWIIVWRGNPLYCKKREYRKLWYCLQLPEWFNKKLHVVIITETGLQQFSSCIQLKQEQIPFHSVGRRLHVDNETDNCEWPVRIIKGIINYRQSFGSNGCLLICFQLGVWVLLQDIHNIFALLRFEDFLLPLNHKNLKNPFSRKNIL